MFGLSHLFYPWGLILQGIALVHFLRRRPDGYWFKLFFLVVFFGAGGSTARECWPVSACCAAYFRALGAVRASKSWKRKFWIILRRPTTKNWASFTRTKNNLPKRARRSRMQLQRAAIPHTHFIIARRLRWDWKTTRPRLRTWSVSSPATPSLITTGPRDYSPMLMREPANWTALHINMST